MFDLEKSITEWREQMRTAGIKTSVQLEELEIHLREDFEQQISLKVDPRCALETAMNRIGSASELKREFETSLSNLNYINETMKQKHINYLTILAVLAIGIAIALPSVVKWRLAGTLAGMDLAMLLLGIATVIYGGACGTRLFFQKKA